MKRTYAAVAALLAAGCSDGVVRHGAGQSAAPTLALAIPMAPGDVAQRAAPVRAGHFEIRALVARCGIGELRGNHAEFVPRNALCRVRVRVESRDVGLHSFVLRAQRLLLDDGTALEPSVDAMAIKRQPESVPLGADAAAEVELWFSLPEGRTVRALRVVGDRDPDQVGATRDQAAPPEAEVPLTV